MSSDVNFKTMTTAEVKGWLKDQGQEAVDGDKAAIIKQAEQYMADHEITGATDTIKGAGGGTTTVSTSIGKGDGRHQAHVDQLRETMGKVKAASKLETDLFRMQVTALTSKMVRKNEAPKEFKSVEDSRVDDLVKVAISKGMTWKNWDGWIKERVELDLVEYKEKGDKMAPVIPHEAKKELDKHEEEEKQKAEVKAEKRKIKNLKWTPPKKEWECPWCKYVNPKGAMQCKACMCRCPRALLGRGALKEGQWCCARCGCKNAEDNQIACVACGLLNGKPQRKFIPEELRENPLALMGTALKRYDVSGDSSLNKSELFKILRLFDDTLTMDQIKKCYKQLDSDDSGEVSLGELFTGMVTMANDSKSPMNKVMRGLFDHMFNPKYAAGSDAAKADARKAMHDLDESTTSSSSTSDSDVAQGKSMLDGVRRAFEEADANKDGKLSMAEFEKAGEMLGVPKELCDDLFKKLDDDGGGTLDMEEFSEALIELAALDPKTFGLSAQRIFFRALNDLGNLRKAQQLVESKKFAEHVAEITECKVEDLMQTRQDDLVRMRQRRKEMRDFKKIRNDLKGGKFEDKGRKDLGGDATPFGAASWKPITEIFDEKEAPIDVTFNKEFKAEHVNQGELGDCYFLTSLSVMATRPGLISKLIVTNNFNKEGVYKVRFCRGGKWKVVTIDDKFPVTPHNNLKNAQPGIDDEDGKGKKKVIWVPLLEKAWAKLYGSYPIIEAGFISEVLTDLTGAPSETFDSHDPNFNKQLIFHKFVSFSKLGYLMGAGSGTSDVDKEYFENAGLVEGHAYALLRVVSLSGDGPDGDDLRLVKLRNPWGQGEWLGPYSDGSSQMTSALAEKLDHENTDDGSFWMEYGDFLNYYRTLTVCKVVPTWQFLSLSGHLVKGSQLPDEAYLVHIDRPTQLYISVLQPDKRGKPDSYQYTDLGCIILKCDGADTDDVDDYEFEGIIWPQISRTATTEVSFTDKNASYMVMPYQFKCDREVNFTTTIYSANPVIIKKIKPELEALRVGTHLGVEEFRDDPKMRVKTFTNKKGDKVPIEYMTLSVGHAIYVILNNMHPKWHFFFKMDYRKSKGLISERNGTKVTADCIPPNSRQVLTVVVCEDIEKGYAWGVGFSFGFKRKPPEKLHDPPLEFDDVYTPLQNTNIALQRFQDEKRAEMDAANASDDPAKKAEAAA